MFPLDYIVCLKDSSTIDICQEDLRLIFLTSLPLLMLQTLQSTQLIRYSAMEFSWAPVFILARVSAERHPKVWRCYLVCHKSWLWCTVPALLIVASAGRYQSHILWPETKAHALSMIVCGIGQTTIFAQAVKTSSPFMTHTKEWKISGAVFILSLATNVIVTGLIVFRIWYVVNIDPPFVCLQY